MRVLLAATQEPEGDRDSYERKRRKNTEPKGAIGRYVGPLDLTTSGITNCLHLRANHWRRGARKRARGAVGLRLGAGVGDGVGSAAGRDGGMSSRVRYMVYRDVG